VYSGLLLTVPTIFPYRAEVKSGGAICQYQSAYVFMALCLTLGTAATTGLLYQPQMTGDGDFGEIDVMKIGRGN
jgi:hypothetical protein